MQDRAARRLAAWDDFGFPYDDEAEVLVERPLAILVRSECYSDKFWVPRSALHTTSELPVKKKGLLVVKVWFARQRRWLQSDGFVNSEYFWPKNKPEQMELKI